MQDDLKKYINLAHNLDNLILKSLDYGNKEKLYESFINGQLFFEQATITESADKTELDKLVTSGITDTGSSAPYIDIPYTATRDITYNRRTSSVSAKNEQLRRPWGDPWIYYSAATGNLYAYKCGRKSQLEITPCPDIKAGEWKNANAFKDAIMSKIFTNIANTAPNAEESALSITDILNLKKKFRHSFYNTYAFFLNKELDGVKIEVYPTYPKYISKIVTETGKDAVEFDLISRTMHSGYSVDLGSVIKKSIKNFVTKKITANGKTYVFKKNISSMLFGASDIFEKDNAEYEGDEIVKNIIKEMNYRVVENK